MKLKDLAIRRTGVVTGATIVPNRLFWISVCGILYLHPVQAQTIIPVAELNFKVSPSEAETIWKALRKLPVEEVENLMGKLRQQVAEQTTPKPVEEKKDVPTPSKP